MKNPPRTLSLCLLFAIIAAAAGEYYQLNLPTLRWFFDAPRHFFATEMAQSTAEMATRVTGIVMLLLLLAVAVILGIKSAEFQWNPITLRSLQRFRAIKRGYRSLIVLLLLMLATLPDQLVVGRIAVAVRFEGHWYFPALMKKNFQHRDFGVDRDGNVDYAALSAFFNQQKQGNLVIMPLVPWDPTFHTDELQHLPLEMRDGKYFELASSQPYSGIAAVLDDSYRGGKKRTATLRDGQLQGESLVFDRNGDTTVRETWRRGELIDRKPPQGNTAADSNLGNLPLVVTHYAPNPPSLARQHYLGTDSRGWDVLAQLYGGFQVICQAAALYIGITFGVGITLGMVMGYFGGRFDLIMQRAIEILSNVPFLFVVMIISSRIGRENVNLGSIILVMSLFSWIGISAYQRTAVLKEKNRDYVAAARVLGASTPRIIFHHIFPNVLSTIITLIPFSIAGVATSLTALDFIGFGLPDQYPSWGTLLADGLANMEAPWIVTSVCGLLVLLLLLITFIGEAVREAFDPKTFTTYR